MKDAPVSVCFDAGITGVVLSLLTGLALQITSKPVWAVPAFNAVHPRYGLFAACFVTSELFKTKGLEVIVPDTFGLLADRPDVKKPIQVPDDVAGVFSSIDDPHGRANVVVFGRLDNLRILKVGAGKQARLALRIVAYDVVSSIAISGAYEVGNSLIRDPSVSNEDLVVDAIHEAAKMDVEAMVRQQTPRATIMNTSTREIVINMGTHAGYHVGDTVVVSREPISTFKARVVQANPDEARITPLGIVRTLAPGDRVQKVYFLPDHPALHPPKR